MENGPNTEEKCVFIHFDLLFILIYVTALMLQHVLIEHHVSIPPQSLSAVIIDGCPLDELQLLNGTRSALPDLNCILSKLRDCLLPHGYVTAKVRKMIRRTMKG
jgi:hypothetical protein